MLFSQSSYLLLDRPVAIDAVERALASIPGARRMNRDADASTGFSWMGGESMIVEMKDPRPRVLTVDAIDRRWPDAMGDPEKEPELFAAWVAGAFGRGVFPGSMERAALFSWHFQEAKEAVRRHAAFVRVRLLAAADDEDPKEDPIWCARIAAALGGLPGVLAYFNPAGEILASPSSLAESIEHWESTGQLPLHLLANIRMTGVPGHAEWRVFDIVGLGQFGFPDQEVVARADRYQMSEVTRFIYSIAHHLFTGTRFNDRDTADGPSGTVLQAHLDVDSFNPPARMVTRWLLRDGVIPPAELLPPGSDIAASRASAPAGTASASRPAASTASEKKKPWWKIF